MASTNMQKINSFAIRAFRETADKDYVHARMAYKASLVPQFLWSSLHALEKYAKCILILNRIPKPTERIGHEVLKPLELVKDKVDICLSKQTMEFLERLENGARFRYYEVSWFVDGPELTVLDRAVWELRRYCNTGLYDYSENGVVVNKLEHERVKLIDRPTRQNTFIIGGWLESVLNKKSHDAREFLVWSNLYYTKSNRKTARVKSGFYAGNSPFYLHPEIIEEVRKYVFVPKEIVKAYQEG